MLFMQIIAGITLCFALSCILSIVFLKVAHYSCCKQYSPLSKYSYLKSKKPDKTDSLDKIFSGLFSFYFSFFAFLIIYYFVNCFYSKKLDLLDPSFLVIQEGLRILLPVTITVLAIFATFKKPYYILFDINSVLKRYKIYPRTKKFLGFGIASITIQFMLKIFSPNTNDGYPFLSSLLLFCLIMCFYHSSRALISSIRIILSDKNTELKLLDDLHFQISYDDAYLKTIKPDDIQNLDVLNDYLLQRLKIQTKHTKKELNKCIPLSAVVFWNATDYAPFPKGSHLWFRILRVLSFIFTYVFLFSITFAFLFGNFNWFSTVSQYAPIIAVASSFILLGTIFLFMEDRAFGDMRRYYMYGRWGYQFLDEKNLPQFYFPRYSATFLFPVKTTRWLIALFNLLTLFRIELKNECYQDLYNRLLNELKIEQPDTEEYFALALAYMLCCTLLVEKYPDRRNDIDDALPERLSQNKLLMSWAEAIWIDMKRDPGWYELNHANKFSQEHKEHVPPTKSIAEAEKQS